MATTFENKARNWRRAQLVRARNAYLIKPKDADKATKVAK